ncbi:CoA transferase [Tibeticola sp.]|uniref:CoA transferase n=1 Tax=Tibeticola sp. TaxID=2005368 RepID=UPI00258F4DC8|nr:CoA transferase [Tibeticola sp.]MCI4441169.1 CoA transferase [Tibeticola sp.]
MNPVAPTTAAFPAAPSLRPLRGVRITSLALNLPGPAALMRLASMGARCLKIEPPAPPGAPADTPGDPMGQYNAGAYAQLHAGIRRRTLDLKTEAGQAALARELARSDVLLTSFRPSALRKLGLSAGQLRRTHPHLSLVAIVGAPGARAEAPGHDLTYLAEAGLVPGLELPPTLFADMAGALLASEAVLQVVLAQRAPGGTAQRGGMARRGRSVEVALSEAAAWLALPLRWGLTQRQGAVGGAHAGYRVYACADGRVAVAALEPHFAQALCRAAQIEYRSLSTLFAPETHERLTRFFAGQTRAALDALAEHADIPLQTLGEAE